MSADSRLSNLRRGGQIGIATGALAFLIAGLFVALQPADAQSLGTMQLTSSAFLGVLSTHLRDG